jgi:predicted XRE-type DNA-binding protein
MARNWRDIRDEAVRQSLVDPARADDSRKLLNDAVQAKRLADIRKARGHRQSEVATLMGVSQARVSKLESGDLSHTELGSLQSYVAALGGSLRIVARFSESTVELTTRTGAIGRD